jgi:hypothetical protein
LADAVNPKQGRKMARIGQLVCLEAFLAVLLLPDRAESIAIPSAIAGTVDSLLTCLGRKSDPAPLSEVLPFMHC